MKFYKWCGSKSGDISVLKIYTGAEKNKGKNVGSSHRVVLRLVEPFLEQGYELYLDN